MNAESGTHRVQGRDVVSATGSMRGREIPWRSLSLLVILAGWFVASWWLDDRSLPSPWTVAVSIHHHVVHGELLFHGAITFARSLLAFVVAMFIGTAIGSLMGSHRIVNAFFDSWLVIGLNVPALLVIILFYVWFGLNEVAAIAAVVVNKAPVVATIVREAARTVSRELMDVGHAFGVSRQRILWRIYLPQLYPQLAAAARSVFALSWKVMLVAELLGRADGIGFQLRRFFNFFDITSILAYSLAFTAFVLLVEVSLLQPLERHANRWRRAPA